ncbi:hypothetical protein Tsubulata_936275 [Turnera subulata]|uniref:Glycosyltransferase n=1 Tax=Turnera subulata TaxID=218843 RepID=A0A9Q0G2K8_9ROSI|nr:hypothetical protein Tsubulata_936275 [Turnera subulata]
MDSQNNSSTFRVLMFPWLGHAHVSPFLELAKKLSKRNFYVYFCSTPVILDPIKQNLTREAKFPSIELVELHLPSLPDLPPHYHTTNGLPPHLHKTLAKAFDMASPDFHRILTSLKPDLFISDFHPSALASALSLNIPTVGQTIGSSMFLVDALKKVTGANFPLRCNYLRDYPNDDHDLTLGDRILQSCERSSTILLVRGFKDIEARYLDELSVLTSKKMVALGPLVQGPGDEEDPNTAEAGRIIEWLDKKEASSVVFIAFGSENYLSKEDREDVAQGLLLSKVSFIWVLRSPKGEKLNLKEALPEGFLEMVGERGLMMEGWAPQRKILSHPSTGGFLCHCGWSSVLESLSFGVPIIGMPLQFDHPANARLVEDVGVGLEIKRDKKGRLHGKEVGRLINEVVMDRNGEEMRKKAKELSRCLREKGEKWIDAAVAELINLCGKKNHQE